MSLDMPISPLFPASKAPATTHIVYLALGSNLGDRRGNLAAALQQLREVVTIEKVSSVYETEPIGYLEQPRFFNIACCGKTWLSAQDLLHSIQAMEVALGRQPTFRNGPRPIDIDILLYDDLSIHDDHLTIPHPRMAERSFVLAPLTEISPNVVHPGNEQTAQELLQQVSQEGVTRLAPNLHITLDRDIQNGLPNVRVSLGRTGVVGVRKSLLIGEEGHQQRFDATFDLYANLGTQQAGVHMSRFSDVLEEVLEENAATVWPEIEILAEAVAKAVVERQKVVRAEVHIHTVYPLQKWTPMSGRHTQEIYGLLAQAVATPQWSRRMIGVEVEGMVACPCAQDMVRSFARTRLQEEGFQQDAIEKMLSVTPH